MECLFLTAISILFQISFNLVITFKLWSWYSWGSGAEYTR